MRRLLLALVLILPTAPACKGKDETLPPTEAAPRSETALQDENATQDEAPAGVDPVEAMRADVAALQARPEKDVDEVEVQHILISFSGAPRMPAKVVRTREEAEALAADLYARLEAGADFQTLMAQHTDDDPVSGRYRMTRTGTGRPPAVYARSGMVPAFGDVGWRLERGEIGVAPHDPAKSPYGWHIVKRLD